MNESEIEQMLRQIPERRRLAEQEPAPLGAFLLWYMAQQDYELRKLQEVPDTET